MEFINRTVESGIATVTLNRGKVNALNEAFVEELDQCFREIENDNNVKAVILTGQGKFFSFGFDIPEFLSYPKDKFTGYLRKFTSFYTYLFVFPKPVIAALNGHAIAGGCMLATACDRRLMISGHAKISLNEVAFGASIFAGSVEMLKFCAGQHHAELIAGSGKMFSAEQAKELGLIDIVVSDKKLNESAHQLAGEYAESSGPAFTSIKRLLRQPIADAVEEREAESIKEFIDIWYSENTWKNLEKIKIHG